MKTFFIFLVPFVSILASAQNTMVKPTPPVYETCQQIPVSDGSGGTIMQMDQECQQRNAIKQRDYNAAMNAYNIGSGMITNDNTGIKEPVKPTYETCAAEDYACESRNQQLQQKYQTELSYYNTAQQQIAKETQQKTAFDAYQAEQSAKKAAEEAQRRNAASSQQYQDSSMKNAIESGVWAAKYAASCGSSGCSCGTCLALSIAHAIFSGMASQQASSNDEVAYNSCLVSSQVAGEQVGCTRGENPNPNTTINNNFDQNGNCKGDKATCDSIISKLPPGTNIKDLMKGVSSFASSKAPYKINSDGTITTKDGKTYSASNFMTEKDMIAAGISPKDAKALMAQLKSGGFDPNSLAAAELEKLKKAGLGGPGYDANAAASGNNKGGVITLNGSAGNEKDLDGKRGIASAEGLSKDFNGDLIGVAGDDIFKMMNRRYKLKSAQDTFIGP